MPYRLPMKSLVEKLGDKEYLRQVVTYEIKQNIENFDELYEQFLDDDHCTSLFDFEYYTRDLPPKNNVQIVNQVTDYINIHGYKNFVKGLLYIEMPDLNNNFIDYIYYIWWDNDRYTSIFDLGELVYERLGFIDFINEKIKEKLNELENESNFKTLLHSINENDIVNDLLCYNDFQDLFESAYNEYKYTNDKETINEVIRTSINIFVSKNNQEVTLEV